MFCFTRKHVSVHTLLSCQSRVSKTIRFVYKVIRDLESIDHLFINPIHRIGLIHKWSLDSRKLKWSVQINVLLYNCKQNISSPSLLVGTTVDIKISKSSLFWYSFFNAVNIYLVRVQSCHEDVFWLIRGICGLRKCPKTDFEHYVFVIDKLFTVVPTKSDSGVLFCLQLLSKALTCTLHLSLRVSIDHLCINPILRIG